MSNTIVLIDSSYYNFYRFFATTSWYNYSQDRKDAAENVRWLDNAEFMRTFEKMWFETIKKICKQFTVSESDIIFARDGENVWRYKIYPEYKANRQDPIPDVPDGTILIIVEDLHAPGPVFKHVNENYHQRLNGASVLRLSTAEADDIIAVAVNYIRCVSPATRIVIISGDHDLLQLSDPGHVEIYQLKGMKRITVDDPTIPLMTKILAGDPSDNIPGAFKGCGKKTAQRLATDPAALQVALEKHGRDQYDLNCTLVNFDNIPGPIVEEIEGMLDAVPQVRRLAV